MITPIEIFMDPITRAVIGMYLILWGWESLFPRNTQIPTRNIDVVRGIASFVLFFVLSSYLPLLINDYLVAIRLFDMSGLSDWAQIVCGLLVYELLLYAWHRIMHSTDVLWRVFHQMHHSSEKLDIPSAFYFSPMDMIGFTVLNSLVFALILGVAPFPTTVILLTQNFLSLFQHANIRTPVWLGYFIQRPEQHAIHHARGVHQFNFSDFPVYDLLFGTFKNPKDYQGEYGFYEKGSTRIVDMLLFRDINKK